MVMAPHRLDRLSDFSHVAQTRREDHRFSLLRNVLEERQIGQVGRGDFIGGHAERFQEVGARLIPRAGEKRQSRPARLLRQLPASHSKNPPFR